MMDWQLVIVLAVVAAAAFTLVRRLQKQLGFTKPKGPGCVTGGGCSGCPWSCQR